MTLESERRLATYPHPYPNGWYRLLDSEELGRGQARAVEALGERWLLARDESGCVHVLEGYCPHMGAALPSGKLAAGCLECPFHGWRIAADGRVCDIPYAERVPKGLAARRFHALERDGQIFVWHGAHGAQRAPAFDVEPVPAIAAGELVARGRFDGGSVRMHLLEFVENGPDTNHFRQVHARLHVPWTGITLPGLGVVVHPRWRLDPERGHVAWLENWATLSVRGHAITSFAATANVEFVGPGVARFHFEKRGLGRIVLYQTHTPSAPLEQRVGFRWFASPELSRLAIWWVVGHWISQWRDDVRIWENKIHRSKPQLVAEDGPILAMRRWYRRFYGEGVMADDAKDDGARDQGPKQKERSIHA